MLVIAVIAAAVGSGPSVPSDFDTDILPILTKAGCNAAACHGAASGRGGFKLSLFGGSPAEDYDAIVRQLKGRRIDWITPSESLLIAKPAGHLEHGGGVRFDDDGQEADLLARWIQNGAPRVGRRLTDLRIAPRESSFDSVPATARIEVFATLDNGTKNDVTEDAVFIAADPAAVEIGDNGTLTVKRRGRHTVVVRYLSEVQTVQITVPVNDTSIDTASSPRHNWIDEEILDTLSALRLPPSGPAEDAALLRRVTLDLTGRLPTLAAIRDYVEDDSGTKYVALLDRLLDSPEFVDYWTYKFAKLLRLRASPREQDAAEAFHGWIHQCIAENRSLDSMTTEMVTAVGDTHEVGPANFYRAAGDARSQAEYFSEVLMGVRLRCANCHNHPLDRWTQDDYHGLAAIFARVQRGREIRILSRGEVTHPGTGEAAVARIPGDRFLDKQPDQRLPLADWITDGENPYFARAMVNRVWKSLMGRGLVEPTDDLRATNPATHPGLLDRLAADFSKHGYNLRHTIRLIASSAAYQRSSRPLPENAADDVYYSHALRRPLEAEVMADAIADVTGVTEPFGDQPPGTRAVTLVDPQTPSTTLDVLGRCSRDDTCETAPASTFSSLTTRLHLLNGPLLNKKITSTDGRLHQAVQNGESNEAIVDQFYRRALGRPPTVREAEFWKNELMSDSETDRVKRLEDFVWSLLNCQAFVTNH